MTRRLKIRIMAVLMAVFSLMVVSLLAVLYCASKENYEEMFEEILFTVMEGIEIEKGTPVLMLDTVQKDEERVYGVVCNSVPFLQQGHIEQAVASVLYGSIALTGFAAVSALLSRWLVKPVEQAWQAQGRFIADASHELKTPLTVALSNLETLLYEQDGTDKDIRRRHLEISHIELLRMKKLIDDLLFIARAGSEAGKVADSGRHIVDFSNVAACCAASFEPVFFEADRSLESVIEEGCLVYGEEEGLRRVVCCLLDNACKYSSRRTATCMELKRTETGCVLLTVKNTGENIPEKDIDKVFERFYRMDASREQTEGFGLGLAIAKEIMQKNRGKIRAASKPGGEVCFYVEMECASRRRRLSGEGNGSTG